MSGVLSTVEEQGIWVGNEDAGVCVFVCVCDAILYRVVGETLSKALFRQNSTESEERSHVDT